MWNPPAPILFSTHSVHGLIAEQTKGVNRRVTLVWDPMFDIVSCMVVDVVQYPICNVTRRVRRHVLDDSSALSNSPARKEVFFFRSVC